MKNNWLRLCVGIWLGGVLFLVQGFSAPSLLGSTKTLTRYFSQEKIQFKKWNGFDVVSYPNAEVTRKPGFPQLPVQIIRVPVPFGSRINSVTVLRQQVVEIPGRYRILPAQPPRVLSDTRPISFVPPDPVIYRSRSLFPDSSLRLGAVESFFNQFFVEVFIYPLRYRPSEKKLFLTRSLSIEINYTENPSAFSERPSVKWPPEIQRDLNNFFDIQSPLLPDLSSLKRSFGENDYPYLIITDDSLVSAFRPLADWKTRKGLPAKILTTQYIAGKYYGRDLAEKVRSCIGFYHQYKGTLWVLLGGDTKYVPLRYAWAMDCEAHYAPNENNIPADLYFSDLDGIWDANKNGIFGEVKDRINMYPDVFVGRFSVDSREQARAFVNKVLTYEKNPPRDYETKMLFLAMILWRDPFTDSGEGKNFIDQAFVPPRFDPITKLYESLGNESVQSATDAMNEGYNIINHDGHAWYNSMGMGNGYFGLWDADHLKNAPRYSILFSIGCWPGAFDHDCMAEHLTRNPNGGLVAFIGNSRYGWGSPGNPQYGYSDRFDQQFFRQIFKKGVFHIGEALALAKASLVPFARQENVYRWCEYEINLFGDPEMPIWTDSPRKLTVHLPAAALRDSSEIGITVQDSLTGDPVSHALVCFQQKGRFYFSGYTDQTGQMSLFLKNLTPDTSLSLTITAHNYLPLEKRLPVRTRGAFVRVTALKIDDSDENGDGIWNPGEHVRFEGTLRNFGDEEANPVRMVLHSNSPLISIADSVLENFRLPPGDSITFKGFSADLSKEARNGDIVPLVFALSKNGDPPWKSFFNERVGTPVVKISRYRVDDRAEGNGNFVPDYGEHFTLRFYLENSGFGFARDLTVDIRPDSLWLQLDQHHFEGLTLSPGSETYVETKAYVNPSPFTPPRTRPVAAFPEELVEITARNYQTTDTVRVTVGNPGFNWKPGQGCVIPWDMGGDNNLWHLSSNRVHGDSLSWYCGDETSHRYVNNMDAYLRTLPFVLDQKSELTFWAWYDVTVYGSDGFYVEVKPDTATQWKILDFIGSGGALQPFLMGNGWLRYGYDLSDYPPGTQVQVQFRFVSDDKDVAEGVYIEDVSVHTQLETDVSQSGWDTASKAPVPGHFEVKQNYPNPFNGRTVIQYDLPESVRGGEFDIYNILGEKIVSQTIGSRPAGTYHLYWDGCDRYHRPVSTGVYIYRLRLGRFQSVKKLLLTR
ncbi:MAG: T9SS type A sorting domain-containing protein [Calditrichaeota bacterium]|nr:T9SS type A sorting domain-containing protein [Calditrichota bacterium]